ncbi:ParB/RepB/Spo0J family partition protein [Natronogracilivirgula saccharolytica]|uniref:ParB/RepB/Spo0J family partition protein n=2 Tax=Natronogracilivirga saccharolytica TaxID=2812953 RepID=A0A8J7S5U0_9BACT|nr:ParB/RepB/Spo0J family partition protein [Natronogracilivirga saccharolytica]
MMTKKVLGRGLGAFFPEYEDDQTSESGGSREHQVLKRVNITVELPVSDIRPNPHQPREDFDEIKLQELSDSIRQHGLIQPVTVRAISEDKFELISGERRLRATKMAGITTIPAYIREVDDDDIIAFALIENVQREQLNPIEVALGYKRLLEECDFTQDQVAKKLGKNRSTVTNMLRLLNLRPTIQSALKTNKISTGHARTLITIEDPKVQDKLLNKAIEEDWSVRQIEDAVRKLDQKKKSRNKLLKEKDQKDVHLMEISNRLRNKYSTRVQIKKKNKGGEIRLEYYSDDDFERLISLLESAQE